MPRASGTTCGVKTSGVPLPCMRKHTFDLGLMPMPADAVGANVARDLGIERSGRRLAPRTGDPALRIDDQLHRRCKRDATARARATSRWDNSPDLQPAMRRRDRVALPFRQPIRGVFVKAIVGRKVDDARAGFDESRHVRVRFAVCAGRNDEIAGTQCRAHRAFRAKRRTASCAATENDRPAPRPRGCDSPARPLQRTDAHRANESLRRRRIRSRPTHARGSWSI